MRRKNIDMCKRKVEGKLQLVFMLIVAGFIFMPSTQVVAISEHDWQRIQYDAVYYEEGDTSSGRCRGSVSSTTQLPQPIMEKIEENRDEYTAAEGESGVPWQVLAAIHYRETNFNKINPDNGQGIFQFYQKEGGPYPPGPVDNEEFRRQLSFLGEQIQTDYVTRNLEENKGAFEGRTTNMAKVKDTFFSYNGRADVYKEQAEELGFDAETEPYEGSPYVMNKYDAQRESMKIITEDGGTIDGTDNRYGAFTLYAALAGESCANQSGSKVVDIALEEYGKDVQENPDGCSCGGRIDVYTDGNQEPWCSDFVSWVYKEAGTPFSGGLSGGWRIPSVANLKAWFQANETYFEKTEQKPQPGDVVFFYQEGGSSDSSSGNHNGIVVEVNGESITTVEGNSSNAVSKNTYNYLINDYVVGFGRIE